jgi:hypothetical protein
MNTRTIFEDNSVSDTDILSDDSDFDTNEYNRMQAFFIDHMGNKSHPDRYVACMHAYSKLRRSEMNDDVESMELDEDEEQDVSVEALQGLSHAADTKDGCSGYVCLPQKEAINLQGYLLGFFDKEHALIVFIEKRFTDNIGYYMTKFPSHLLPGTLLSDQESLKTRITSLTNRTFSFDVNSAEVVNNGKSCNILFDGPAKNYYCDKDLLYSIQNGLVIASTVTANTFFVTRDTHIWFEDNEQAGIDLFKVDVEKSERVGVYYLEVNNSKRDRVMARNIARAKKHELYKKVTSVKKLLKAIDSVSSTRVNEHEPSDSNRCLQYALCGADTFKPVGSFTLCPNGKPTCACQVSYEASSAHADDIKAVIKNRKMNCTPRSN